MLPNSVLIADSSKKEGTYELIKVGETFGPITYPVDALTVKSFAFAQDDYNPWCFSDENPFGRRIVQAACLINDLLWVFMDRFNPNTVVGLHTQEELWFHNPVFVGESVTVSGSYVNKYEKRGKGYCELVSKLVSSDGRPLITHRGVEIMRVVADQLSGKNTAPVEGDKVTGEFDESIPVQAKATASVPVGTPLPALIKHTSRLQTQVFSRVDMIRSIHSDLEVAARSGYPGLIVQGQQQVSYVTEMLSNYFGAPWFISGYEKIKLIKPVVAGETVVYRGVVKDKTIENGRTKLHLHVWGRNAKGEMVLVGWANAFAD